MATTSVILVDTYNGGSHAQLTAWLSKLIVHSGANQHLVTLPPKKWHWRLRASSLHLAQQIPSLPSDSTCTLFVTSMVNLTELLGLRPDLQAGCRKVVFFHENQLEFPVQDVDASSAESSRPSSSSKHGEVAREVASQQRGFQGDFHYGWAQIVSALSADVCAFNSSWCMESFLSKIDQHMRVIPDKQQRVSGIADAIRAKSVVAYFPVYGPPKSLYVMHESPTSGPLVICWNHRHEFDKNPGAFFDALKWMHFDKRLDFRLVLLGESFAEEPPEFAAARSWLEPAGKVLHWGYAASREEYYALLSRCDVVVSTAIHEFFGVAVIEAVACGCFPLCPAQLSYPELLAPSAEQLAATAPGAVVQRIKDILSARRGASSASPFPVARADASAAAADAVAGSSSSSASDSSAQPAKHAKASAAPAPSSPYLYKTDRDLRQRLYSMAKDPQSTVRGKRAGSSPSTALAAGSDDPSNDNAGTSHEEAASGSQDDGAAAANGHEASESKKRRIELHVSGSSSSSANSSAQPENPLTRRFSSDALLHVFSALLF